LFVSSFFYGCSHLRYLHSFPTRRSSDLLISFTIGCIALMSRSDLLPKSLLKNFNIIYFVSLLATQIRIQFTFLRQFDSGRANLRSEEHTSELQSRENLVCRLLLEKKNKR